MQKIIFFIAFVFIGINAYALEATEAHTYFYGDDLDIASVVLIKTSDSINFDCGALSEEMIYKDSNGKEHKLIYKVVSKSCQW
ncbi:DUF2790 domain-containing protein [Azomonas agilis]|nr:DUF2790 domain-containing protein [Azomonas agilis]